MTPVRCLLALPLLLLAVACGSKSDGTQGAPPAGQPAGGGVAGAAGPGSRREPAAAVPIQVQPVTRRDISNYLETNGTLEAENEVDLVARTVGPITELRAEEGDAVAADQLLARIDDREARNQVALATVAHDEARLAFERTKTSHGSGLVSQEAYDAAVAALDAAEAQLRVAQLQLAYTEVRAPFAGLVVTRYVRLAQYVTGGSALFRLSDFTPLLCPIEVPEKDLSRLRVGQPAKLTVEPFPGVAFAARVLRIRPTVDATSGTVTVTLQVEGRGQLRPGMFARVYLETDVHRGALVIPRRALVLDSIGDTVFVRSGEVAVRREVRLGVREEDSVEVVEGLAEGEDVVVLGQDGLADGTPVTVLAGSGEGPAAPAGPTAATGGPEPGQLEVMRARMKERGLSDEEIEQRLERMRTQGGPPTGGPGAQVGGGIPPQMEQRIRDAAPEELDRIRERMRSFGMSDEQVEATIRRVRGEG